MTTPRYLLAGLLVVIGLAGGAWFLSQAVEPREPAHATVLPVAQPLPPFSLIDDRGNPVTRESLRGGWHLLFFGFTHCPDICPATLQQLAAARARLAEQGVTPLPEIVLVSVDPERDSPATLAAYVAHFGAGVRGITGSGAELDSLAAALGIHFEKEAADEDGRYNVNHTSAVLVIDGEARLSALFSAPHSVDAFVTDLPLLVSRR